MKRKTFLVIDDDSSTIKMINEYLNDSKYSFEVLHATSASLALEISHSVKPDLVMVNCELPDMSGFNILQRLKTSATTANIPVIVMASPMAFVNDLYVALSEWPVHYLGKPISKTDLNIQVNTALALTDPLKEIEKQKKFISYIKQFTASLMDTIPTPLFYQNKDGSFFGCNKAMHLMFRTAGETIAAQTMSDILPPSITEMLEKAFSDFQKKSGDIHFTAEIKENGDLRYLMVLCSAFYKGENEYAGCIGAITDITGIVLHERQMLDKLNLTYDNNEALYKSNIEKLQTELNSKQRELSIHLGLLKNAEKEMDKMLEDINTLKPYLNDEGQEKLPGITRRYKHKLDDDSWLTLQAKFDETNHSFFELLEKKCPAITKTEKTLCAYIKMNLTSSEISKITYRSLNSINVALTRLRTKLKLNNNKDLKNFISDLKPEMQTVSNQ
jgi:CheY-like chemotaxis protein